MAAATDLESVVFGRAGSTPVPGTNFYLGIIMVKVKLLEAKPGTGKAVFEILEGDNKGNLVRTSWNPADGDLPIAVGDIDELEVLGN